MARDRRYDRSALGSRRLATFALDRGGLLAAAVLVLYVWIAPSTIVYGDNAELSALGTIGGVAHPSGYPLYLMWLRAWSWLPVDSPAHAAAIATAILTGLNVLVLHAACRAWGARPLAATAATALYAAAPYVLRIQSEAEVFALNCLLCSAVCWLAADAGPLRGRKRIAALALAAGLGMTNHMTCVLLAPVGLYGVYRGIVEDDRRYLRGIAIAIGALCVGLLPYAYLLAAHDSWISWGTIDGIPHLVNHIIRKDYGGPGNFSPVAHEVPAATNLWMLARTIGRVYLFVPAVAAVGALGWFAVRPVAGARAAWIAFAISFLLAGPLLVLRFNVEPVSTGLYVIQRFHLLPAMLLAIPLAVGLDLAAKRVADRIPPRLATRGMQAVLTVVGWFALAAPSLPYVARMHSPAIEQGLRNMLETLPPNAIVIGAPDAFHFGLGYLQGALGERRDVTPLTMPQMGLTWYRERVRERTGIVVEAVPHGSEDKLSVKVAEQAIATGRPLFIDPFQANIAAAFPTYPYGLVFRVLPRGTPSLPMLEVFALNKELYGRYRFGYEFPGPDDQLAAHFHRQYARAWKMISDGLRASGHPTEAREAFAFAAELSPDY